MSDWKFWDLVIDTSFFLVSRSAWHVFRVLPSDCTTGLAMLRRKQLNIRTAKEEKYKYKNHDNVLQLVLIKFLTDNYFPTSFWGLSFFIRFSRQGAKTKANFFVFVRLLKTLLRFVFRSTWWNIVVKMFLLIVQLSLKLSQKLIRFLSRKLCLHVYPDKIINLTLCETLQDQFLH